jgi:hypothetical protein
LGAFLRAALIVIHKSHLDRSNGVEYRGCGERP